MVSESLRQRGSKVLEYLQLGVGGRKSKRAIPQTGFLLKDLIYVTTIGIYSKHFLIIVT